MGFRICIVFDYYLLQLQLYNTEWLQIRINNFVFDQFQPSIIRSHKAKFRSCRFVIKSIHSGPSGWWFYNNIRNPFWFLTLFYKIYILDLYIYIYVVVVCAIYLKRIYSIIFIIQHCQHGLRSIVVVPCGEVLIKCIF